jgi:hypothetical protein
MRSDIWLVRSFGIADLRCETLSKFGVGAIHELPLPQILRSPLKKIIIEFSNADYFRSANGKETALPLRVSSDLSCSGVNTALAC